MNKNDPRPRPPVQTTCSTCFHWGRYGTATQPPDEIDGKEWNHCGSAEALHWFAAEDPYVGIDTAEDFTCPAWERKPATR